MAKKPVLRVMARGAPSRWRKFIVDESEPVIRWKDVNQVESDRVTAEPRKARDIGWRTNGYRRRPSPMRVSHCRVTNEREEIQSSVNGMLTILQNVFPLGIIITDVATQTESQRPAVVERKFKLKAAHTNPGPVDPIAVKLLAVVI